MSDQVSVAIITCGHCGQKMKVPAQAHGKTFKCVKCGEPVHLPETVSAPPPAPPAPPLSAPPEKPAPSSTQPEIGEAPLNPIPHGRIGEILVQHGLITEAQLWQALEYQAKNGGRVIEVLIQLKHLTSEGLHACLSRQPGIASIDLSRFRIERKLLEIVPKELAMDRCLVPIDRLGKLLTVAMACPLDTATIQDLESLTGLRVKAVLSKLDDIQAAVEKYYGKRMQDAGVADSYFSKLLAREGATKKEEPARSGAPKEAPPIAPKEAPPIAPKEASPIPPKEASAEAAKEVVKEARVEAPLTQEILDTLRRLSEDTQATVVDVLRVVQACPSLERAVVRAANSDLYDIGGQNENVPVALAVLDKEGVAALAGHLLSHAIEI